MIDGVRFVLTDIEGTTTAVSFVHDVLFPYARARLPEWLPAHASDPEVAAQIEAVRQLAGVADLDAVLATLLGWIDADEKRTPLKALQGRIWEDGYRDGTLRSHVYPDVAPAVRAWRAAGLRLGVYSSGSVQAQRLLFGHTPEGDLTPLFEAWFDTNVGGKRESGSYARIARALGLSPAAILFLSDTPEELDAASTAGIRTTQLARAEEVVRAGRHRQVASFADLA